MTKENKEKTIEITLDQLIQLSDDIFDEARRPCNGYFIESGRITLTTIHECVYKFFERRVK